MPSSSEHVRLLAALSVLWLVCDATTIPPYPLTPAPPESETEILTEDIPHWWMPMFCAREASYVDGYLCGFGLRLRGGKYFIGHLGAIQRINALSDGKQKFGSLWFRPNATLNLMEPLRQDLNYIAYPIQKYPHETMLFESATSPRDTQSVLPSYIQYPVTSSSISMETNMDEEPNDCYLMTYGSERNESGETWPRGIRKLKKIGVKVYECKGPQCFMYTAPWGHTKGVLCGIYANLGNPIICGKPPNQRVTYLVNRMNGWDLRWRLTDTPDCLARFVALKVAHLCSTITSLWGPEERMQCVRRPEDDYCLNGDLDPPLRR